jgi:hypothetical protein
MAKGYSVCTNEDGYMVEHIHCEYISESATAAHHISARLNKPVFVINLYCGKWVVDVFIRGECVLSGKFHSQEDAMYWCLSVTH